MESHSIHGRDISSFDLPSTHRLPTVSAADALEDLRTDRSRYVSTGHSSLDHALVESTSDADSSLPGGFQKGQVDEIWGPPGSGKTTFGLQLASDALKQGQGVVWVVPNVAAQRLQVLQFMISSLQKLAATRDVAVVLLTQCATRMQTERGATLTPAINAMVWDQGITTRLVLFRDWLYKDHAVAGVYFAGIQKLNGKAHQGGLGEIFAFDIQKNGFVAVPYDAGQPSVYLSSHARPKRKLGDTNFEVADSEEEDYGWDAEDTDAIPAMPPQWQGSEDILIGQHDEDGNRLDEASDAASDASIEPNQDDG
ncbi:DNA repair rhp55 [Apiospora aurea]|uniref:DNA repair rhp55 n=1 Tax=Apiospora aurea TaxID=335848 RepID=A0ABR1QJP5_9PEZI